MSYKVLVIDKVDEEIQYVAEVDDNEINLRRSKAGHWNSSAKGEHIGTLVDDGNGVNIKLEGFDLDLNYSNFCELFTLMELKMGIDDNMAHPVTYLEMEE